MAILKTTLNENAEKAVKIENILWDSSNVLKTSYNFNTSQLFVTFKKGGVWYYNGVKTSTYKDLKESASIGSFINKTIKPDYTAIKVGVADEENVTEILNEINDLKINKK